MKIENEFTVHAPIQRAWEVLTDFEQVIPLMPGARLIDHDGDTFTGAVKVKVGPVTTEFTGKGRFLERDDATHRAVLSGKGKESRGSGNAAATVTTQLTGDGEETRVTVDTDLKIVGKLAQFGAGTLQQISEKLLAEFVDALEGRLAGTGTAAAQPAPAGTPKPTGTPKPATAVPGPAGTVADTGAAPGGSPAGEPAPIDVLALTGADRYTRYAPALIAAVIALALAVVLCRRR